MRGAVALLLGALTLTAWLWGGKVQRGEGRSGSGAVRHVVLLIGDGMQLEHERAASRYLQGKDFALSFHSFPYSTSVTTWSVTSYDAQAAAQGARAYDERRIVPRLGYDPRRGGTAPYPLESPPGVDDYFLRPRHATDSASAATAWATGVKTDNGNLAWLPGDPPDGALDTIAEILRTERGYSIGIVTSVPFTHATPAAHVSHNASREDYYALADEILRATRPEVVIGGGHPDWSEDKFMAPALLRAARARRLGNQVFVERQAGLDSAAELQRAARLARERSARFFGLFGGDDGSVGPWLPEDAPGHPQLVPSTAEGPRLSEATRAALTVLSADPEGFFLMVEQGEIDWANHDADYRRMVGAVSDLDEAVRAVQQFVDRGGDEIDWNNTLLVVTADHATGYMRLDPSRLPELGDLPEQVARVREGQAEDEWPEYLYPQGEVTYATGKHTNELVRLYAIGAGMEAFTEREGRWYPGTRLIDNTQIFHALAAAAGAPRPERLSVVEGKAAARR